MFKDEYGILRIMRAPQGYCWVHPLGYFKALILENTVLPNFFILGWEPFDFLYQLFWQAEIQSADLSGEILSETRL